MKDDNRIDGSARTPARKATSVSAPAVPSRVEPSAAAHDGGPSSGEAACIEAVIFDYGQVLSLPLDPASIDRMAELSGISPSDFLSAYVRPRLRYDRGETGLREYWDMVTAPYHVKLSDETLQELFLADVQGWMRVRSSMVEWAERVRASGRKIGILSNMPEDHMRRIVAHFDWIARFDVAVFSCTERLVKPEPAIYRACTARLGLAAERCLFVDDMAVNIEAARACGLHGIVFESESELASHVARYRGLPPFESRDHARL